MLRSPPVNLQLRCVFYNESFLNIAIGKWCLMLHPLAGYICTVQRGLILVLQVVKMGMMVYPNSHCRSVTEESRSGGLGFKAQCCLLGLLASFLPEPLAVWQPGILSFQTVRLPPEAIQAL